MLAKKRVYISGRNLLRTGMVGLFLFGGSYAGQSQSSPEGEPLRWKSKARLHRHFRSTRGELVIDHNGVEFRPLKEMPLKWSFTDAGVTNIQSIAIADIKSVRITPEALILISYQNKGWHRPGDREFRFDVETPISAEMAAEMIRRIGRPSVNSVPDPQGSGYLTLPARHRTATGGSNGVLRLRDDGIDYLDSTGKDSRSWRWADIETLANPDPYQFRVGGYVERFDFELKQPLSKETFERLWNNIYTQGLNIVTAGGERDAGR